MCSKAAYYQVKVHVLAFCVNEQRSEVKAGGVRDVSQMLGKLMFICLFILLEKTKSAFWH